MAPDSLASGMGGPAPAGALPKAPVFDWPSSRDAGSSSQRSMPASVEDIAGGVLTSSGRAALFQALSRLRLPAGTSVLVPGYHCPSMIAPVVRAGLRPVFFGVRADGTPLLEGIALPPSDRPRAMIAAHYFGLPLSLEATRAWCDSREVVLIEDCAHCLFGQAGNRPVGRWGDYAIASLTKFYPVPEAGLLVSAQRPLADIALPPPGWRAQLKGGLDVLEVSNRYGRLRGARAVLGPMFAAKNRLRAEGRKPGGADADRPSEASVTDCDMGRVEQGPLWISRLLVRHLDRRWIYRRRRENYAAYVAALVRIEGARLLHPQLPDGAAPYVCPLWVDDAERVYHALRLSGMPVFRWDRVWPQTPPVDGDVAPLWRYHVLQLLCHQDLRPLDIATVCARIAGLLPAARHAVGGSAPAELLHRR